MKIGLAQINLKIGDFEGNGRKIIAYVQQAKATGCNLVIFPELTTTGYPPEDLLENKSFIQKNLNLLNEIVNASAGIGIICGFADPNPSPDGRRLFNAAALIHDRTLIGIQHKSLLPNYDVFDEMRHFEPGKGPRVMRFNDRMLGLTICEDAWNDKDFWDKTIYPTDPVAQLMHHGAEMLINISASPFHAGKQRLRRDMFRALALKYRKPVVLVNLVGGNDSLVFDGGSFMMNAGGQLIACAPVFEESLVVADTDTPTVLHDATNLSDDEEEILRALEMGLRDYLAKCGFGKCLIGLSGGIDSALVAVIAARAIGPEKVTGVSMPSRYSSTHSLDDARQLAHNLGIRYSVIPIEPMFETFLNQLTPHFDNRPPDITEENLQARLRGNILMALSNKFNAMVLSTGNKSELAVGYATIYGDMCGGLAVISDVPKTMVYRLAEHINRNREIIPRHTILKPPSAELRPNQTDQDALPPYDILDGILKAYVEEIKEEAEIIALGYDADTVRKVLRLIDHNEYKRRQAAPGLRVTTKAFGFGRRLPIAQGWR